MADDEAFWDFSKKFERNIDIRGTINNRVKYNPAPEIKVERANMGTEYAKEFRKKEEDLLFQNSLNFPGTSSHMDSKLEDVVGMDDDNDLESVVGMEVTDDVCQDIYKRYTFNKPPRTDLPIFASRDHILDTINNNKVTIITSATGTGKTTQVSQYIIEDCYKSGKNCNIIITQPRRIAAMTIAKRVADERACELGTLVGYQVGLHKKLDQTSHETRILYCTTGILLQKLIQAKNMNAYTHVILDEVHERDADMDFLLIVIRKLQASNSPHTKVILMSATINTNIFAQYFKGIRNREYKNAPVIELDGVRNYPINIKYLNTMMKDLRIDESVIDYDVPGISDKMYHAALKLVLISLKNAEEIHELNPTGHHASILVFLPGLYEIECFEKLLSTVNTTGLEVPEFKICIMHSSLSPEDQRAAFVRTNCKKIILATNIAESSITLPEVRYVIDFCLTKYLYNDSNKNLTTLELDWTSRNSCEQRAGRTGRVAEGFVYRLVSKSFYERAMRESCVPEMRRCPLENIVLKAKLLEMGSPAGILALALDPPNKSDILNSILTLKEVGALLMLTNGSFEKEDGELTYMGRIMAALPIDVHLSKLIVMGYLYSVLDEAINIAAGLNIKSIFKQEYNKKLEMYSQKLSWADGSGSDAIAIINAFKSWNTRHEQGQFRRDPKNEKAWCDRFQLEIKNLYDMKELIKEIENRLEGFNMRETVGVGRVQWTEKEKPIIIKICIAAAFFPNYFLRAARDENLEREIYASLGGKDPFNTVYLSGNNPKYITEIYEDIIKQKFVEKGVCYHKDNIKVEFDANSTKIFVRFLNNQYMIDDSEASPDQNNIVAGKVLVEVYKALKFRRTEPKFTIYIMDEKQAQRYAIDQKIGKLEDGLFRLENYYIKHPGKCVLPSIFKSRLKGLITHVEHPSKFFVKPLSKHDEDNRDLLRRIELSIGSLKTFDLAISRVPSNLRVIVRSIDREHRREEFLRGITVQFHELENGESFFEVYLIDVGASRLYPYDCIFPENKMTTDLEIFDIPPRVFECTLSQIQPSFIHCPKGKWTRDAIDEFKRLVENAIVAIDVYSLVNDVASVELVIVPDLNVNHRMMENGFAQPAEENYMSKMDHDVRLRKASLPKQYQYSREVEFKNRVDLTRKPNIKPPRSEFCRQKLTFSGPFSPLETELHPLSRFAKTKGVGMDVNSVNAIVLDTEPQERNEKLFIAASVSETRGNLTLRETTAMPSIPGLAMILALTFAPVIEIRRTDDGTRFTSILTGLGYDEKTGVPYFAEHDSLFRVDVDLDEDDFSYIKHLRYLMSHLLFCEPNRREPDLVERTKTNCKLKIKELIIKLLSKERPILNAQYNEREMNWGHSKKDVAPGPAVDAFLGRGIFETFKIPRILKMPREKLALLQQHEIELNAICDTEARVPSIQCKFCNYEATALPELRLHLLSKLHIDRVNKMKELINE